MEREANLSLPEIPAGSFIDRVGSRLGLSGILAGWSFSNMAQALARGVASFSGLCFLMGLFECGNYPAGVKTIGEVFPADQRALVLRIFDSGSLIGPVIAPPLVVFIAAHYGWHHAFFLPSVAGLVWLIPWLYSTKGKLPQPGHKINMPLSKLLCLPQPWGVVTMRAFSGPRSQRYVYRGCRVGRHLHLSGPAEPVILPRGTDDGHGDLWR